MSSNKKGEFDPLALIGKAVLVLLILVILMLILTRFFKIPIGLGKCSEYGKCIQKSVGCGATEMRLYLSGGCSESEVCCQPREQQTSQQTELQDLTPAQQEAVENAIILTLNKDPTPIADRAVINLKEGLSYDFKIKLNEKLNDTAIKSQLYTSCAVYIKDNTNQGNVYSFFPIKDSPSGLILVVAGAAYLRGCVGTDRVGFVFNDNTPEFIFKPSMLDSYKNLELNVIVFKKPEESQLVSGVVPTSFYSNTNNWFAYRTYRLNIEPVVKISGISGTWVAKDDMTISCTDVTCTKFRLALVKLKAAEQDSQEKMITDCRNAGSNFVDTLAYITGTSIQQTGIPLNLNIGGFRLPIGQQRVIYQTAAKPITIADNKASILIDKATMISSFYGRSQDPDMFVGDSTYLCVEATTKDGKTMYTLSKIPLKVDVLPPYIDQSAGMTVVYPDRLNMTLTGTYGGKYYYKDYPKVRISGCYDFGQSGCANYDYYIHPGEFIQLNSITGDIGTGITALVLTEGLNMLMNAIAAKDPLNTICPYVFSTDYRPNTNPEIRFPYRGQGIMCIRAADKVGNKELYWKALWLPDQMFSNIVAEATS